MRQNHAVLYKDTASVKNAVSFDSPSTLLSRRSVRSLAINIALINELSGVKKISVFSADQRIGCGILDRGKITFADDLLCGSKIAAGHQQTIIFNKSIVSGRVLKIGIYGQNVVIFSGKYRNVFCPAIPEVLNLMSSNRHGQDSRNVGMIRLLDIRTLME